MNWRWLICGIGACAGTAVADTNWVGLITHPVKDPATHAMLRAMSDEKDPMAREESLQALVNIRDPRDQEVIHRRLRDDQASVRVAALQAAATLALTLDAAELTTLGRDPEPAVRAALMTALPALTAPDKLNVLKPGITDADVVVRRAAAQVAALLPGSPALVQEQWASEPDGTAAAAQFRAAALTGSVARVQQALTNHHPAVVVAALEVADAGLSKLILEKLADPAVAVREAAVRAVGRLKLADAVPALLKQLPAADPMLRPTICRVLGSLGGGPAIDGLAQRLADDPDWFTQQAAAEALVQTHTDPARDALVARLGSPRITTRRAAVRALGTWGQPALAQEIHVVLNDPEPLVAAAAADALGQLQNAASPPRLRERLAQGPPSVQARVAWALGQFHDRTAVPQLMKLLWAEDPVLQTTVAEVLGEIGDREAVPALRKMLFEMAEHMPTVREQALRSLQRLGDHEMVARALQIATERVVPPPPRMPEPSYDTTEVRMAALRYLMEWGDPATGNELLKRFSQTQLQSPPNPRGLRPVLAATLTKLTGRSYQPLPDETYIVYSVESLGLPPYQFAPPAPGVRLKP